MSAKTDRRPVVAVLLGLTAAAALGVFGIRALTADVAGAPGLPGGLMVTGPESAKRDAVRPATTTAPALDASTWEDTDGTPTKPRPR
jgi:hypothetical protein